MNLLRAEFVKFFTTKTWIWLLIGTVALALLQPVLTLSFAGTTDPQTGAPVFPPIDSPMIQTMALSGASSATIFIAVLGVIGITAEYRHATIVPTFLATPVRWKVIVAKFVCYLILGLAFAAVASLAVVALVWIWISTTGGTFTLGGDNWKVLVGAGIAAALYGVIGVSVGALIRNQIGAVSGLLAYMFVVEPILGAIPATQDVFKFLPGGAASALYTYAQPGYTEPNLLEPVAGGLLLGGYAVVLAAIAYAVSTRREVG
ncbi:ABC transporter permease [Epidermidibacterium keratini]|uniref:ABC transporter permease n=1 Tax=Epidermidibacterium keratini TaxID=1891644 RepID=A0A7L4YSA7_9ACTN|nr:ABC transporter permease [Epidermidibacterium keratini]QHC01679.1 ABC transporter permease [Epidermidibacterium keratini]